MAIRVLGKRQRGLITVSLLAFYFKRTKKKRFIHRFLCFWIRISDRDYGLLNKSPKVKTAHPRLWILDLEEMNVPLNSLLLEVLSQAY